MGEVGKGFEYVKSAAGLLKLAELAILVIAAGIVGYFFKEAGDHDYDKKDRIQFFLAAVGIAAIVVVVFFTIFLTGLHKKVNIVWTKTATGVFVLMGILLLVASSMLAEAYKSYKDDKHCDIWETFDFNFQCKQLMIGLVFGFIAAVIFVIDAVIHFTM
ncbi:uncharacterized protein LOC114516834 [Dendronephthya gigantea]|uniref:uncharacterized protein LOC114516834 n=1 Tax=Dendronephthya gigantea TaxID=151771 RepID=UPI00106AEA75|nr:uncharacterized protein LOC114516834 [Dendronephthya gigantea]